MKTKITLLQMAEATGYILRNDGSQIISTLATPADLIYHMGVKHEEEVNIKQAKQREDLIKKVEELKHEDTAVALRKGTFQRGDDKYNKAIDDVLVLLSKNEN